MTPNRAHVLQLVRERNWSGGELGRRMGISRAEANRFLNGQRIGGKKLMTGLLRAFPEEPLEKLFRVMTEEPASRRSNTEEGRKKV